MGAASDPHRRNNDSLGVANLRVSARISAAKGFLASGITLKPGGIHKKSFEEKRASVSGQLNQEYPSLQDFELLRTLGTAKQTIQRASSQAICQGFVVSAEACHSVLFG